MLDKLSNFITEQKLFQPKQKILLAVSGGIDSMVMVDLFQRANFNYALAHCNFNLRAEESDEDQKLVEAAARDQQVVCFVKAFQTREHAQSNGISIQMAARDLRNNWFERLMEEEQYDFIALAHHLNDSLETVLFNIAKGTGIEGLKGILPKQHVYIRPLMFASREMIAEYAAANGIEWREDQSNSADIYHRNLIRHNVIPELKKINPSIEQTYASSRARIAAAVSVFNNSIKKAKNALVEQTSGGIQIDKNKLSLFEEPLILLHEILAEYGFNFQQSQNILDIMHQKSGKRFYAEKFQLVVDRNFLFVFATEEEIDLEFEVNKQTEDIELPDRVVQFRKISKDAVEYDAENKTLFVDFDKLSFPLKLRNWQYGDWFQPLGMRHKKKLSDFMIDEKIPLNLKNRVMVISSGDDIVCVPGHRIDERHKLEKDTRNAFMISIQYADD